MTIRAAAYVGATSCLIAGAVHAQRPSAPARAGGDSVAVSFADADLRSVVQALGRYLPKPVLLNGVPATRVSFDTPVPVPRSDVLPLLRGLAQANGLELIEESAFFRVQPRRSEPPPVPAASPPQTPQPGRPNPVELFVIRLRHARAADVAATVDQLFGGQGRFAGPGGLSSGTLSDELRRTGSPALGTANPAGPPAPEAAVRSANLHGPVTIVPDEITNSLLIRAGAEDFAVVQQAVGELDIRPLQVLIEVLIVEMRADRTFTFGNDLVVPTQAIGGRTSAGGTLSGGGVGDLVIRVMNLSRANVNATLGAAASRGDAEIISRPVLLASNNTEARLLVGAQRPFIQVSRSLPTETPTRDQVVQYRDVGTRLVVRPTINHDGYVSLQIQQEVNAATAETQFDAPVISTREAFTRVLVRDGQTVMLGGLRDLQRDRSSGGVPILSSIPLLGGLFGRVGRRTSETELYLFLTPRILRTDADADSVTAPRLRTGVEP